MPLFSIVIPTRNRAYLLRYALQSALNQTFDDYEILVSNNNCTDDTEDVVREVGGDRVRYIRTDKTLSMPDHWDFALNYAKGEYITYLCDDDAISPNLLAKVSGLLHENKVEIITWNAGWYFHPTWNNVDERNTLLIRNYFQGGTQYFESKADLRDIFSFTYHVRHPKMLNSFASRKILEDIKKQVGRVFLPSCPDYSFCVEALALTAGYLFIDEPLYIAGSARESIGSSTLYNRNEATHEFKAEFKGEDLFSRVPLKSVIVTNYVGDTLLLVKEKMPSVLSDIELNWESYFLATYGQIVSLRTRGIDTSADEKELFEALERQPEEVKNKAAQAIEKWRYPAAPPQRQGMIGSLRARIRNAIDNSTILSTIESAVRYGSIDKNKLAPKEMQFPVSISSERYGFTNILECLSNLDNIHKDFTH
ncbi:MAG: glycosyltransferase family 2 protein [Acidobacteria bacterium]|nr:glycosyltransferase family 2 protein [Acidobacteriota bacterium]